MRKVNELFEVIYGNKFDLNKMSLSSYKKGGVNFVGRSSQNHGVSAVVDLIEGVAPFPAGVITVALGGTKLLSSFVQSTPFYTAQNVAVLIPKANMTFSEKLFMCICIRHNRFRYSAFGREANRTLRDLLVPDIANFPEWINDFSVEDQNIDKSVLNREPQDFNTKKWNWFEIQEIFELKKGKRLTKSNMQEGHTPYIGAIDSNNGYRQFITNKPIHNGNTITVNYNGSVGEAYYQPKPYWATDDVNVLYPRFAMNQFIALFICAVIKKEKYRFNYGRKWHMERMNISRIKLPVNDEGQPDYLFMQEFIQSLPYSSQI